MAGTVREKPKGYGEWWIFINHRGKDQLGHSSIQMTVDIYGHLIPTSNRDALNSLVTNTHLHPPRTCKMKKPQPTKIAAFYCVQKIEKPT